VLDGGSRADGDRSEPFRDVRRIGRAVMPATPTFPTLLQDFFHQHLVGQRQASPRTVATHRDALRLLPTYTHDRLHKSPSAPRLIAWTSGRRPSGWPAWPPHCCWRFSIPSKAPATMARGPATHVSRRCSRFFHYAAVRDPTAPAVIPRALAIPTKCFDRPLLGFLSRAEVEALLAAPDRSTWSG